jgi:hypothetical protein
MRSRVFEHANDRAHRDRLAAALALAEDFDGDRFDRVSGTPSSKASAGRGTGSAQEGL